MNLISRAKTARMTAMKNKDTLTKSILTTLLGELETVAKREQCDITDDMVVARCKKFIDANNETLAVKDSPDLVLENAVLAEYLPTQLDADALRVLIANSGMDNIGSIMGMLKKEYIGKFDGTLASKLVREFLSA
jgi:uncharacterized protein YqeY